MRHILVTGGAGFIGSHFVDLLLARRPNDRVTVLDALTYAGRREHLPPDGTPRFGFVRADLRDAGALAALFAREDFTDVVHCAAESHVDRSIVRPGDFIRTNVVGTFHLLECLRERCWRAGDGRRLVHVSTDEVFGSLGSSGSFREDARYDPRSPYSASKAAADHLVRAYHATYALPILVAHCSNNFGPRQASEKLIPLVVARCLERRAIPVYGTGENVRDWIHVGDFCAALELILRQGRIGESYNVGARNERRNIDLVQEICSSMDELRPDGAPHAELIEFVSDRPGHDFRYAIDPGRIERELGWAPARTFADGLRETVRWYVERSSHGLA